MSDFIKNLDRAMPKVGYSEFLVINLPPNLTEVEFLEQATELPQCEHFKYYEAEGKKGTCKAYFIVENKYRYTIKYLYDGYYFHDARGVTYGSILKEFTQDLPAIRDTVKPSLNKNLLGGYGEVDADLVKNKSAPQGLNLSIENEVMATKSANTRRIRHVTEQNLSSQFKHGLSLKCENADSKYEKPGKLVKEIPKQVKPQSMYQNASSSFNIGNKGKCQYGAGQKLFNAEKKYKPFNTTVAKRDGANMQAEQKDGVYENKNWSAIHRSGKTTEFQEYSKHHRGKGESKVATDNSANNEVKPLNHNECKLPRGLNKLKDKEGFK